MKNIVYILALVMGASLFHSCSPVKVVTDTREGADFSNFQTFKVVHFVNEEDHQAQKFRINPMNRDRIKEAVTREAEARGMQYVENDPDILILWATDVDIEKSYSSHTDYAGGAYWGYRGRYYYGGGPAYTTTSEYKYYIGKLSIAVAQHEDDKMLWYGQGTKELSGDAGKAGETINLIVGKIMEEFPIGQAPE